MNSKGQVTLPKALRTALGINPGIKLPVIFDNHKAVIKKTSGKSLLEIREKVRKEMKSKRVFDSLNDLYDNLPPEALNR